MPPFFFALDMSAPTQQEIDDAIATALLNAVESPLREQSGTRVIEERSIDDLLKAKSALAGTIAANQPHFGIRRTKLIPPECG